MESVELVAGELVAVELVGWHVDRSVAGELVADPAS
jgi:hypothetical protein